MRVAPVFPIAFSYLLDDQNTHFVSLSGLRKSNEYRNQIKAFSERGDFLVLGTGGNDYSPVKDWCFDWNTIREECDFISPRIVVMPSRTDRDFKVRDFQASLESAKTAFPESNRPELMFVPFSFDTGDLTWQLDTVNELNNSDPIIKWIGLHKRLEQLGDRNDGGRDIFVKYFSKELADYKLWGLGIYKEPLYELMSLRKVGCLGVDSSKFWRFWASGRSIDSPRPYPEGFDLFQDSLNPAFCWYVEQSLESFVERWSEPVGVG